MDIVGVDCGTWYSLYEISLIVWSEASSYFHLSSSATIVSQVTYLNVVFNHISDYLFQLPF